MCGSIDPQSVVHEGLVQVPRNGTPIDLHQKVASFTIQIMSLASVASHERYY